MFPHSSLSPNPTPGHAQVKDPYDTIAVSHMREVVLLFDKNVEDRVFANDVNDRKKLMLIVLPNVGTVAIQLDLPLLEHIFHAFLDKLDLLNHPEDVMYGVMMLGLSIQMLAFNGNTLGRDEKRDLVLSCDGVEPVFYTAQFLPAVGSLPPVLLLEHRESDVDDEG